MFTEIAQVVGLVADIVGILLKPLDSSQTMFTEIAQVVGLVADIVGIISIIASATITVIKRMNSSNHDDDNGHIVLLTALPSNQNS